MTQTIRAVFLALIAVAALAARPSAMLAQATAQQLEDVVYLKDGSIIRGTIVEQRPGESILIRTRDGNQFRYRMDQIERLTKEAAQKPEVTPVPTGGTIATFNPLGFVQFGPNVEVQRIVAPTLGVSVGLRLPSLGLLPHLIASAEANGTIGFTWLATFAVPFYPRGQGPSGWFLGPRVEFGKGTSADDDGDYDDTIVVGGMEFGFRWVRPSGFNFSIGGQGGVINDTWTCTSCSFDGGSDVYAFAMAVLAVGKRF